MYFSVFAKIKGVNSLMRRFYLPTCCLMMFSEQQRTKDLIKKPIKSLKKESAEDKTMNVKNRILLIRLSEKLSKNPAYSQQLGLSAQLQKSRIKAKPLYSDCGRERSSEK